MNATTHPTEYEANNNQLKIKTIKAVYEIHVVQDEECNWINRPYQTANDVVEMFKHLKCETKEYFIVLHLDAKNKLLCKDEVSVGSLTASIVSPREVMKSALLSSAASIILIHNHPSGDPTPSREDREITQRLVDGAKLLGIRVLDHVIIGDDTHYSFADRGEIEY